MAASTCLTLREIENELREVAEWHQLGVQLGLTPGKLKTIERDHPRDVQRCKTEVLHLWLQNVADVSWESLAGALEGMGSYATLAHKLREKVSPMPNESQVASTPTPSIGNGRSLIAGNGFNGHSNIYNKVKADPPLAEHLQGLDIEEDELIVQTHDIRGKFLVLFTRVRRCLESEGVTVREFVGFLKQVPGYARRSLLDAKISNLYEAPDLIAVFESVGESCSWFNHSLLGLIIDAYCGENKTIKKGHQEYCAHLQKYCKNRVKKFPFKNGFGNGGKKDKALIVKIDRKWEEIQIEQLEEVVFYIACILKVSRHTLHLCCVENGCVRLTLLVPSDIPEEVFPLTTEQEAAMRDVGVTDLQCGSYHFSCQDESEVQSMVQSPGTVLSHEPYSPPAPTYKDWLRGWREWARTRKRGKMAQFVLDKLEENKQACWLDITTGKFELIQWHTIAEEYFKKKTRNSDLIDAPVILRKGLPRAFPGLEEVKSESIKEGMQYKSRVFQATPQLMEEVMDKGGFTKPHPRTNYPTAATQTPHVLPSSGHSPYTHPHTDTVTLTHTVGDEIVLHRLVQIAEMEKDNPKIIVEDYDALTISDDGDGHGKELMSCQRWQPRQSSCHLRQSLEEHADYVAPLIGQGRFYQTESTVRKMLLATHSDADSAVSMSFNYDESEIPHHRITSSGLSTTKDAVDIELDPDAGYTFANSVFYECAYIITEDYPAGDEAIVFKAGDRIVQIGSTPVRDKGLDEFAELLQQEAVKGTTIQIVPRVEHTPVPSTFLSVTSLPSAYFSVTPFKYGRDRRMVQSSSEQAIVDSITMKVSNLLDIRTSGTKRTVTIPRTEGGYGFKIIGGNMVGLFIVEVRPRVKNVMEGDQILKLNGQDTSHMTHFEAMELMRSSERLMLEVTENIARFKLLQDKFEFDSFFIRSCLDHTSADPRDMELRQGTLMRVVNTTLYEGYWVAWTVDESTGLDSDLRRIPSPANIKKLYGKDAYERVTTQVNTSAQVQVA